MIYKLITRLKWLLKGKPMIRYSGFNCGLCGKWVYQYFEVPTCESHGKWWDTWSLCDSCANCKEENEK